MMGNSYYRGGVRVSALLCREGSSLCCSHLCLPCGGCFLLGVHKSGVLGAASGFLVCKLHFFFFFFGVLSFFFFVPFASRPVFAWR